ncbi:MAG TPA: DNA translocase FtsK 4TM domain-containing protein [Candidatus Binatia bacterium]
MRRSAAPGGEALHTLRREAGAVGLAVGGVIVALAIVTYQPDARASLVGPLGAAMADVLAQSLGVASWAIPIGLLAWGVLVFLGRLPRVSAVRLAAGFGALLASATLCQLAIGRWREMEAGGIVGGFLSAVLREGFGDAGAWVIALAIFVVLLAIATGQSLRDLGRTSALGTVTLARRGASWVGERLTRQREAEEHAGNVILLGPAHVVGGGGRVTPLPTRRESESRPQVVVQARPTQPAARGRRRQVELPFTSDRSYCLPDLTIFDEPPAKPLVVDHEALIASSRVLETKLATFGVDGKVREIHPGPVITTYEFEPGPSIKVNRIAALADDLAMAMSALSVRIIAPIPGKSVVGIEVSNKQRERVLLREIVDSDVFRESPSVLTLALGKDTKGNPVVGDLARMPHLLVAGATGTGKSVFLNSLLTSILMRATPRDVRLVLIDPKMLELSTYEHIPHLLVPVITEARAAVTVLNNLVKEMNERYRLLKDKGVRNLESYNRLIAEEAGRPEVIELADEESEEGEEQEESGEEQQERLVHQHLPRIVVIIDELADLIMTRRDCEVPITMLAQKARAAGIHLVVATQRPSVDVITGLIKANFPARISFKVAGAVNSRTILDSIGAERLLGDGDMLFLPPDNSKLQRLHGAYVSDAEIKRITDFVRGQEPQRYQMDLLQDEEEASEGSERDSADEPYDSMYDEAVRIVTESGKASISYVQRRLQVGYNRAARMIECMEREGVVSPADHRGVREVLAPKQG